MMPDDDDDGNYDGGGNDSGDGDKGRMVVASASPPRSSVHRRPSLSCSRRGMGGYARALTQVRPGDWFCTQCGAQNFVSCVEACV